MVAEGLTWNHVVVPWDGQGDSQWVTSESSVSLHVNQCILVVHFIGEVNKCIASALTVRTSNHFRELD